jgi:hypothetical protein
MTATVSRIRRLAARAMLGMLGVLVSLAVLTFVTTPSASASQTIAGIRFSSAVDCGDSFGLQVTNTNSDTASSYARAWVYDYSTGRWTAENVWHPVNSWSAFQVTDLDFDHAGYYYFWIQYAQYTTTGWQYSGEYITSYNTHSGFQINRTSYCYIGA